MNGIDDRARVLETDALARAVTTAGPACVNQPNSRLVFAHFFRKQLGVFARMPD